MGDDFEMKVNHKRWLIKKEGEEVKWGATSRRLIFPLKLLADADDEVVQSALVDTVRGFVVKDGVAVEKLIGLEANPHLTCVNAYSYAHTFTNYEFVYLYIICSSVKILYASHSSLVWSCAFSHLTKVQWPAGYDVCSSCKNLDKSCGVTQELKLPKEARNSDQSLIGKKNGLTS